MKGLLHELRRRKVVRTAVVYAAGAFAALQAADLVLPRLGVPDSVMTALVLVALLGAPVAMVVSWAFDLTADGFVRADRDPVRTAEAPSLPLLGRRALVLAAVLVLLGVGLGAGWFLKPMAVASQVASDVAAARSVAVLPFANSGGDAENEWFADGLSEEVLNRLARMSGLRVAGRTSSFHYKRHDGDLRAIGAELGVAHLLEGSVRRADDRLRVTVQLVSASDGLHLWSDSFDRQLDDVFAIQDEIARAIATALQLELVTDGAGPAGRTPLAAYETYLEARTLIARRGDIALGRAIELLEHATRADGGYAPAWGALAQAHALHRYYGGDLAASLDRAERAARRALELDASLITAHIALGGVYRDRHEWAAAEQSYRRALALNPDDVEANVQYAHMLGRVGHGARALGFMRRAAQVDPMAPLPNAFHGYYLFQSGEAEAGMAQIERARRLDPELNILHQAHVSMLIDAGDIDRAIAEQERIDRGVLARDPHFPYARLHELLRRAAPAEEVRAYLRVGTGFSRWSAITHWHWAVRLRDPELALAHILSEREGTDRLDASWTWARALAPVRRLPGFARLVEELRMPAYWHEHGWPDTCRPLRNGGLECE